jgi:UDP-GlcNAc:undecaprenyl-phosphate GlcNAc-1-phosphate transferase
LIGLGLHMNGATTVWFLLATILPGALVSWAAGFVIRRVAPRWGFVDEPGHRKVHAAPTPLGGGLAIWLGVLTPFAAGSLVLMALGGGSSAGVDGTVGGPLGELLARHAGGLKGQLLDLWVLLGAASVVMVLGLFDDRRGLDWRIRLAMQVLVATAVVLWRGWQATAFISLPWLTAILSIGWIVVLVNSFNMLDNMDSLSGGVAAIAAAMLAGIVLWGPGLEAAGPQLFVGGFLLVMFGALLGFLWHNRPTARLFMGDAGSYFVGFCMGVITLLATFARYGSGTEYTLLAPLCVLAVPLYDMTTVLWIRLREGRSPFQGDTCHISHRLVELGFGKVQAVLTIYLMTATCGLAGLLLPRLDAVGAVIALVLVACVLAVIAVIELTARSRIRSRDD